jgi:hypothetical protein
LCGELEQKQKLKRGGDTMKKNPGVILQLGETQKPPAVGFLSFWSIVLREIGIEIERP